MVAILKSNNVSEQHLGRKVPKFQLKASSIQIYSRSTRFVANFTIEMIWNEAGPVLK